MALKWTFHLHETPLNHPPFRFSHCCWYKRLYIVEMRDLSIWIFLSLYEHVKLPLGALINYAIEKQHRESSF